jgi:biopolymer transport protein TolQ
MPFMGEKNMSFLEIIKFIYHVGWVAKVILTILCILSIIAWAIIIEKMGHFRRIKKETQKFLQHFRSKTTLADLYQFSRQLKYSSFARILRKSYSEIITLKRNDNSDKNNLKTSPIKDHLRHLLDGLISEEIQLSEKGLVFLATTVSVSPFLGLFGTVWGVMEAFVGIGKSGSADISTIGPGIAEALITTIGGLAVAIPVLMAHNLLVHRLRRLDSELSSCASELIIRFHRENIL